MFYVFSEEASDRARLPSSSGVENRALAEQQWGVRSGALAKQQMEKGLRGAVGCAVEQRLFSLAKIGVWYSPGWLFSDVRRYIDVLPVKCQNVLLSNFEYK